VKEFLKTTVIFLLGCMVIGGGTIVATQLQKTPIWQQFLIWGGVGFLIWLVTLLKGGEKK